MTEILFQRASEAPDRLAYTFLENGEREVFSLTYDALAGRVAACGRYVAAVCKKQDRVLIALPAGPEFFVWFLACLYAGVIAVPLLSQGKRRKERLMGVARDCDPRLLLTLRRFGPAVQESLARASRAPALPSVVYVDDTADLGLGAAEVWSPRASAGADIAFLQYTSGSTDTPKGVMVSHANLICNLSAIASALRRGRNDVGVCWLPHYHDMGLIDGLLSPLFTGYPNVVMSPESFVQKPWRWLKAIMDYGGTTSGGPNFAYELCLHHVDGEALDNLDLRTWRSAHNGAEPISAKTLERFSARFSACGFRKAAFLPCYGLAENTLAVSIADPDAEPRVMKAATESLAVKRAVPATDDIASTAIVSCGRPVAGSTVIIVDPQTRRPREENEIGEVWVGGASVARGYWGREQEREDVFHGRLPDHDAERFLRTGDLGFIARGELYLTGRLKDLIVMRGQNIYPHDVENQVQNAHPALRGQRTAVFSTDPDGTGERLVVVQELAPRFRGDLSGAIIEAIRQSVADAFEVEVHDMAFVTFGGIPTTTSGKVRRGQCKRKFLDSELSTVFAWRAPAISAEGAGKSEWPSALRFALRRKTPESGSALREFLHKRCAALAGVPADALDVDRPLSAYGFDSAKAVALVAEVSEATGCKLSPTAFYDYPSINAFFDHLWKALSGEEKRAGEAAPANPSPADGAFEQMLSEVEGMPEDRAARMLTGEP